MDCGICCEKFNKSTRKPIECQYCNNILCTQCVITYYTSNIEEMHCMNCKNVWLDDFIQDNLTKTMYNNVYKRHQTQLFLDREKSLLPSTQDAVQREVQRRENEKQIKLINEEIEKEKNKAYDLNCKKHKLIHPNNPILPVHGKCNENNCKGYIQSNGNCGICNKEYTEFIKSNETQIECSKCNTELYTDNKQVGAWCYNCKQYTDKTSIREYVSNNNKYYGEFLRSTPINDLRYKYPCPYPPRPQMLNLRVQIDNTHGVESNKYYSFLCKIQSSLIEVKNYVYSDRNNINIYGKTYDEKEEQNYLDGLRVKYLEGKIEEDDWYELLVLRVQKNESKMHIGQIMNMYINVLSTLISISTKYNYKKSNSSCYRMMDHDMEKIVLEMYRLKDYVNEQLRRVNNFTGVYNPYRLYDSSWRTYDLPDTSTRYIKSPLKDSITDT